MLYSPPPGPRAGEWNAGFGLLLTERLIRRGVHKTVVVLENDIRR